MSCKESGVGKRVDGIKEGSKILRQFIFGLNTVVHTDHGEEKDEKDIYFLQDKSRYD